MGVGKSTFAFSNDSIVQDGGSTTIGITRDNQSYSHRLRHGYGQFAALPVGDTSHVWSPTAADLSQFWAEVPSQKSRLIDVTLDTYNGTTLVGSDRHQLTITLSKETGKPTLSDFTITDSNDITNEWGIIVPGKSEIEASETTEAKYGAFISRTVYYYGDNEDDENNEFTSIEDLVASIASGTPTDFTIGCKTVDTRGFATTSTLTKTVAAYSAPTIDMFEVIRCDNDGNENDSGTKVKVVIDGSWSAMKVGSTCKNPATFNLGYKARTDASYTYIPISVTDGTVEVEQVLTQTFDADTDYYFSVSLTDTFDSYSQTDVPFSNSQSFLYVSANGSELVFGSESGGNVQLVAEPSVNLRNGTEVLAKFGAESLRIGKEDNNHVTVNENGMDIYNGDVNVASFGEIARLGSNDAANVSISNSGVVINDGEVDVAVFSGKSAAIGDPSEAQNILSPSGIVYRSNGLTPTSISVGSSATWRYVNDYDFVSCNPDLHGAEDSVPWRSCYYTTVSVTNAVSIKASMSVSGYIGTSSQKFYVSYLNVYQMSGSDWVKRGGASYARSAKVTSSSVNVSFSSTYTGDIKLELCYWYPEQTDGKPAIGGEIMPYPMKPNASGSRITATGTVTSYANAVIDKFKVNSNGAVTASGSVSASSVSATGVIKSGNSMGITRDNTGDAFYVSENTYREHKVGIGIGGSGKGGIYDYTLGTSGAWLIYREAATTSPNLIVPTTSPFQARLVPSFAQKTGTATTSAAITTSAPATSINVTIAGYVIGIDCIKFSDAKMTVRGWEVTARSTSSSTVCVYIRNTGSSQVNSGQTVTVKAMCTI